MQAVLEASAGKAAAYKAALEEALPLVSVRPSLILKFANALKGWGASCFWYNGRALSALV